MSKDKTAAVTKITLTIDKNEFTLTPEEIKDLKLALDQMYPVPPNIVREYYPQYVPTPVYPARPWWQYPYSLSASSGNVNLCATTGTAAGKITG